MEEYKRTVVTHYKQVEGEWIEVPDPSEPVEWEEEVTYIEDATSVSPCGTTVVDLPEVPKGKHWLRKGQFRGHTESDIRAYQKRVAKRRAKKKRK